MKLTELSHAFPNIKIFKDELVDLKKLKRSSSDFTDGDVFVAIKGNSWDGHEFLSTASKTASLLVFESEELEVGFQSEEINYLKVDDSRKAIESLANLLSDKPTESMYCVGITGTNGKTTTNYCVETVLNYFGKSAAIMGTIDHHLKDKVWETKLTSPGPIEFYTRIIEMKKSGADALSMEMSSHALDQMRTQSLDLNVGIFTNLSQDHLDYHKTMDRYFEAKTKIHEVVLRNSTKSNKQMWVNADDTYSSKFEEQESVELMSFGKSSNANLRFELLKEDFSGMEFKVFFKEESQNFKTNLIGDFNLYNLTAAIAVGINLNKSLREIQPAIASVNGISGRLERVDSREDLNCFVDYSHTPDALENCLKFLSDIRSRNSKKTRIICVFGAGGDRDRTKRPLMAKAAEKYSDSIVVCSDNPRTEEPMSIIDEIATGFTDSGSENILLIEDRSEAISKAVEIAKSGDVILIAGKGHETYQEIKGQRKYFSDQEELKKYKGIK